MLTREGWDINMKRTLQGLGPAAQEQDAGDVKAKLREGREEAVGPNDVWATDLSTISSHRHEDSVLTLVDTFSRYVPVLALQLSRRRRGQST